MFFYGKSTKGPSFLGKMLADKLSYFSVQLSTWQLCLYVAISLVLKAAWPVFTVQ